MSLALQALPQFASFILLASLKATLLVALVLLIQRLARTLLSASARYCLWLTVIISLVTPIGFSAALPADWLSALPAPAGASTSRRFDEVSAAPASTTQDTLGSNAAAQPTYSLPARSMVAEPAAVTEPTSVVLLLPYLWLAGVLVVLAAIAVSGYRFSRLVGRATTAPQDLQYFLQGCMRQTSCKVAVTVLHSTEVQVPMIAGLFRPVLLLPRGLEQQVTREQLRHVFIHELMHLQRGDIVSNWIVAFVQALHWFNPVVWFAFFCMRQDRELACDAATLKHLAPSDRAAYGHTLLQLNDTLPPTPVPALALGILDSPSDLQRRILMLVQSSRYKNLHSFIATLLFLPLAAVAFSQPAPREPEPAAAAEPATMVAEPATTAIEPAPPAAPTPVESITPALVAPAEPTQPVVLEVRTFDAVTPNATLLAQTAATEVTDPFTVQAATSGLAAVAAAQEPAAALDADLSADVQAFAELVSIAKEKGVRFIEELDEAAVACEARGEGLLSTLSGPCTKTRRALQRGQIFQFGYQCFALASRQEDLAIRLREAGQAEAAIDNLLRGNEQNLKAFCSKETYSSDYPAFAGLYADSESLEYYSPADARPRRIMAGDGTRISSSVYDSSWGYFDENRGQSSGGLDANNAPQSNGGGGFGYSPGAGGVSGGGGDAAGGGAAAPSTPAP